jgi:hypothetical protein
MIKYFIILIITSGLISQENDFSSNIEPLLVEELSDLELMLIADINTNSTLKSFFELNVINESIQLNAPTYDRFAMKNNIGMLLPLNTSSSIYLDAGIEGWMEANKYISNNNSMYSRGFFNSSTDKFSYYNTRKTFIDTDNYFKDPWDQRAIDDYIRYLHTSPSLKHSEINTIYDRNR